MSDQSAIVKVNKYFEAEQVRARFADILGSRGAGAYISSVLIAVADNDKLQECSPQSIYLSALRAASIRLSVDPSTGQAYLVPFKNKATLIVGYKGLVDMAVRTNKYRYINAGPVYEGEIVEEDRMSGWHKIAGHATSKEIIGWIASFEMTNGFGKTIYMTNDELLEHAGKYSKNFKYDTSLWKSDFNKMCRKTVLRLLMRQWGYLDPSDVSVLEEIEKDASDEVVEGNFSEQEPTPEVQPEKPAASRKKGTNQPYVPSPEQLQPSDKKTEAELMKVMGFDAPVEQGKLV